MKHRIVTQADLGALVTRQIAEGTRVIAPVPSGNDLVDYRPIRSLEEADVLGGLPRRSLKEFFRPSLDSPEEAPLQLILGARPCDAAGVVNLDNVMGAEYRDPHWLARRAATTIVSVACPGVDRACFCSAVELGPDSTTGADALLVPLDRPPVPTAEQRRTNDAMRLAVDLFLLASEPFPGAAAMQAEAAWGCEQLPAIRYLAKAVTPRGAALLRGVGVPLADLADFRIAEKFVGHARERVTRNLASLRLTRPRNSPDASMEAHLGIAAADGGQLIDSGFTLLAAAAWSRLGHLPDWLARNHDHAAWSQYTERCQSCGTCSAVCSTSPCFDAEDGEAARGASRPGRASGSQPFHQRVMHKFSTYPRRFRTLLCTGCGRCSRACRAGMSLPEALGRFLQLAETDAAGPLT
jgi:ferredoxin